MDCFANDFWPVLRKNKENIENAIPHGILEGFHSIVNKNSYGSEQESQDLIYEMRNNKREDEFFIPLNKSHSRKCSRELMSHRIRWETPRGKV
jgi:hypothetical protein